MIADMLTAVVILTSVVLVGFLRRSATLNPAERFTASRQLSWLTLGTSLAASAMSADTPLLIAGAVYTDGLAGNWFWWAGAPGTLATLFFFARMWRRSGVLTEVEVFRLRYGDGPAARRYRALQALLEGVLLNVLVLASNAYAFGLVLNAMLARWRTEAASHYALPLMVVCFVAAAAYALLVGFRGLVRSDAVGFLVAVAVAAILAVLAISGLPGGPAALADLIPSKSGGSVLDLWPAQDRFAPLLLLCVGWWHAAPGRGMLIQRVIASRDERSAARTVATFAALHYVARPWGWYLIGAAALHYLPVGSQPDSALPALAGSLLPDGLFGIVLAVTALAFMGCVNSRLNFGASYMVNDVALAMRPGLSRWAVRLVEAATVVTLTAVAIALVALGVTGSIRALYQFLGMTLAGTGFVAIARWYWWRTSIECEIASLTSASAMAALALRFVDIAAPAEFAVAVAVNFAVGALVTIALAYLGPRTPEPCLVAFHERVEPEGPGWRRFREVQGPGMLGVVCRWLLANAALFSAILAVAALLSRDLRRSALLVAGSSTCLLLLGVTLKSKTVR